MRAKPPTPASTAHVSPALGIAVIPAGCPNMFGATSDPGHKGLCVLLELTGKIPRRIETAQPTVPA